jgi:hypothetical protein
VNLIEAIALLEVVSDFHFKASEKKPDFCIYDNQKEGYILCVRAHLISEEHRSYIKEICESRNLRIRESEGYPLIIYAP